MQNWCRNSEINQLQENKLTIQGVTPLMQPSQFIEKNYLLFPSRTVPIQFSTQLIVPKTTVQERISFAAILRYDL